MEHCSLTSFLLCVRFPSSFVYIRVGHDHIRLVSGDALAARRTLYIEDSQVNTTFSSSFSSVRVSRDRELRVPNSVPTRLVALGTLTPPSRLHPRRFGGKSLVVKFVGVSERYVQAHISHKLFFIF